MTVLCETFRAVYTDLIVAAAEADPALLAKPNPVDRARAPFPTCGDFVAYIVSSHLAYHLGQLFSWRAAAGLGRARAPDGAI